MSRLFWGEPYATKDLGVASLPAQVGTHRRRLPVSPPRSVLRALAKFAIEEKGEWIRASAGTQPLLIEPYGLCALQSEVLIRRGVREPRDQPEPALADPRTDPVDEGKLPDRSEDRSLDHDLLDLVQGRLALAVIELDRLLLVQIVDVGIAAIGEDTASHQQCLDPRGGVAEGTGPGLDDVFEFLFLIALDKGGPFNRPQFRADADLQQIVEHGLADIGVGRVAVVVAGVKAVLEARLGQQLLRRLGVIDRWRRLPEEFVMVRHDRIAGDERVAERQRLVAAVAVDRETGGLAHPWVVPRRFRVPLIGKIEAENALNDRRFQRQPGRLPQLLGEFAADRIG